MKLVHVGDVLRLFLASFYIILSITFGPEALSRMPFNFYTIDEGADFEEKFTSFDHLFHFSPLSLT
jgi:hypothetical protein